MQVIVIINVKSQFFDSSARLFFELPNSSIIFDRESDLIARNAHPTSVS